VSLLVATPAEDHHDPGAGHRERAARLLAAIAGLDDVPDPDAIVRLPPRLASPAELSVVHDPGYLEALADLCAAGGGALDPDTAVSPGSWETARMTAGAGLAAVEALQPSICPCLRAAPAMSTYRSLPRSSAPASSVSPRPGF
jgi:acetoin utilization deacetylase AcuC-like enzyme